jgi:PAS domain S-box-containing protein
MTQQAVGLADAYRQALLDYLLHQAGEGALLRALEVGRQALAAGLSVLDLATMHHAVMRSSVLDPLLPGEATPLLTRGEEFLAHSLVPYEMTHRGFVEANARLRELNEVLERRVAERTEALRESEERFRRLAENAPDAIYRYQLRPSRGFTYMSPAVAQIVGYTPQEFYADADMMRHLAHAEDRHAVAAMLDGEAGRIAAPVAVRVRHKGGHVVWLEMRHVPICDETGALVALEGIARDITERKQAEAQRAELLEREQAARAEAEAVRLREAFLAVAAHELKTPVTSLRGFTQLLIRQLDKAGSLDPPLVRRTLQVVDRQSEKLARLASQLLDVSQMEVGKLRLDRSPTDLTQLIEGVVAAARLTTERHTLRVCAPAPVWALVDAPRFGQVAAILVDNAVKYSPEGGTITVAVRRPATDTAQLTVRDHGIGIPPEHRQWIFDRFYQAHTGRTGQHLSGVGLGLYIARQVVELHGGRIRAEHPSDGGTRFIVTLPTNLGDAIEDAIEVREAGRV